MYTQILRDDDIYNIIVKCLEERMECKVTNIADFRISRSEEIKAKGYAIYRTKKGRLGQNITAIVKDFYCCIVPHDSVWIFKKPYAKIMVDIIRERGNEYNLSSEDYKREYNTYIKRQREQEVNEAKRHLEEAEQEYNENIIK